MCEQLQANDTLTKSNGWFARLLTLLGVRHSVILSWQDSHSKNSDWLESRIRIFKIDKKGWPNWQW